MLAFTMAEVLVGVSLMGILFVSLYGGMSSGFALTQVARENLRATQIMLERMEGVRLYNWNQLVYSNWVPGTFTNWYYPLTTGTESRGIMYVGRMTVGPANLSPSSSYSGNMRTVTVTVDWVSANVPRSRTMTT
jgi:type II secretory pathway pseudopilin PulG